MKIILKIIVCIILLTSFGVHSDAATYYVSTTGNNSNDGLSSTTPWQTIAKVNSTAFTGGDFVLFKKGDVFTDAQLSVRSGISTSSPVTYGAYGTGQNPRISNGDYATIAIFGNSYVTIDGVDFDNTAGGYGVILANGTSHITFKNLKVGTSTPGIYMHQSGPNDNIIIDTLTFQTGSTGVAVAGPSSEGLRIVNSLFQSNVTGINYGILSATNQNIVFDNNEFIQNSASGISFTYVNGIVISNSVFHQNGTGIYTGGETNSLVKNLTISNVVISSSTTNGLAVVDSGGGIGAENLTIHDSLFDDNGGDGIKISGGSLGASNLLVYNSTSTRNTGSGIVLGSESTGEIRDSDFSYNYVGVGGIGGSNIQMLRVIASFNSEDGIDTANSAHLDCDRCVANENGIDGTGGNGDGFSWHGDSTGTITNSIAMNNKKSSIAHVDNSDVDMFNNIFYHDTVGTLPLVYVAGSGSVSNSVFVNPSKQGTGLAISVETSAHNNNVYGFNHGTQGASTTVADYNNIFNYQTGKYNCVYDGDCFPQGAHDISVDPLFVNISTKNFSLTELSPLVDAGTIVAGRTVDYNGNPIYGNPDIGPFEFQPPYSIQTDEVNTTGNIRVYQNGKYRYTTATSSTQTVPFSVTPVGGFNNTTYGEFMNISNVNWGTNKSWTASSSLATSTIFTIGDLIPNRTYSIKVDGVLLVNQPTNDQGVLSFTYSGGWSTHEFLMEPVAVATTVPLVTYGAGSSDFRTPTVPLPVTVATSSATTTTAVTVVFQKNLSQGNVSIDVKNLQKFLNEKGFMVSKTGPGSQGKETMYFGPATKSALARFQKAYNITPAAGFFGPITRGIIMKM